MVEHILNMHQTSSAKMEGLIVKEEGRNWDEKCKKKAREQRCGWSSRLASYLIYFWSKF